MACVLLNIAEIGKFALQATDLIRFLGLLQGVLVLLAGIPILADLAVSVSQMLGDRGIAAGQVDRSLQLIDRLLILPALIVDPSQAINIEAIFGLNI